MDLDRNSHHVFRIMYHFVWIPKYRHKVFVRPYRETLKQIISKIGYDYNINIVELEIPTDNIINKIWYSYNINIVELEIPTDHIHMVVKFEPKLSPSRIMQIIKSIVAKEGVANLI